MKNSAKSRSVNHGLCGVFAAMVTPMRRDGEVDLAQLAALTEHLIAAGVHGLSPLGSTGEFYALTTAERDSVLRVVVETARGRVPIVPGTNAGSTRAVIRHSRLAESLGCAGVLLAAPYYSLPTPGELYAHFKAVNDAIGVPIMLYNYPGRTGVDMPPKFVARLAELKNIRYIKESTGEMPRIALLRRLCGDALGIFCGCDTLALQSFLMGAIGWTGGVVNALPRSHVKLYELAALKQDYDQARAIFEKMLPALELMETGGRYTCWVKRACRLMGHDCGEPRGPLGPATAAETESLRRALRPCRGLERP